MLVRIILGRLWVSMVVHTAIVDGMDLHAKWGKRSCGGWQCRILFIDVVSHPAVCLQYIEDPYTY